MVLRPGPERGQERGDVRLRHVLDRLRAGSREEVDLAPEISLVGLQRVGREAALDREVIEVDPDGTRDLAQPSTSASDDVGRPWASPTGG